MTRKDLLTVVAALVIAVVFAISSLSQDQPNMTGALEHLKQAEAALNKAEANKGGHRAKALEYIAKAKAEVNAGIKYAETHPDQPKKPATNVKH